MVIRDNISSAFTGVTYTATQSGGAFGFNASGSGNLLLQLTATALLLLSSKVGSGNSLRSDATASFGNVALSIVEGLITDSGGNVFAVADSASSTITPSR